MKVILFHLHRILFILRYLCQYVGLQKVSLSMLCYVLVLLCFSWYFSGIVNRYKILLCGDTSQCMYLYVMCVCVLLSFNLENGASFIKTSILILKIHGAWLVLGIVFYFIR